MTPTTAANPSRGLGEARRALLDPAARMVLRRELEALLQEGWSLGPCRLRRVKLKPGRKLSAYYDAELCGQGGTSLSARAIAISWEPRPPPPPGSNAVSIEADAIERGLRTPFSALHADVPSWGARILVSPLDETFPQLVRLSDPRYAGAVTPGALGSAPRVSTIRYRPGQRHVLRFDFAGNGTDGARTIYAKLYREGFDHSAFFVAGAAAGWLEQVGGEFAATPPLAHLRSDETVLWEAVCGRPLSRLPRHLHSAARPLLRRAGALLARLHGAPIGAGGELPRRDLASELRATRRACEHISALLPGAGAEIAALLERARDLYARLPQESPTFVHGDFKLDHLWEGSGGVTVMDLDSACSADPALDIGKLLADLRWQPVAGLSDEHAHAEFLHGYGIEPAAERLARARVWEAVWLIKIAARRVPVIAPSWGRRVEDLVQRARILLERPIPIRASLSWTDAVVSE